MVRGHPIISTGAHLNKVANKLWSDERERERVCFFLYREIAFSVYERNEHDAEHRERTGQPLYKTLDSIGNKGVWVFVDCTFDIKTTYLYQNDSSRIMGVGTHTDMRKYNLKVNIEELLSKFWATKFTETYQLRDADMNEILRSADIELTEPFPSIIITDWNLVNGFYEVSFSLE